MGKQSDSLYQRALLLIPGGVINIDPDLRERAGECGYRSIVIALGCAGENLRDQEVLSYEGPFGVGYMVAVLTEAKK